MFEVFSAVGTVGLSIGATTRLDEVGKIIIIICMLAGRVGPLTFLFLLIRKSKKKSWKVITEDVSIA
jgi:trk system potassium uptake protein TrkH